MILSKIEQLVEGVKIRPTIYNVFNSSDIYFLIYGYLLCEMLYGDGGSRLSIERFGHFNAFVSKKTGIMTGFRWDLKIKLFSSKDSLNTTLGFLEDFFQENHKKNQYSDEYLDLCQNFSRKILNEKNKIDHLINNIDIFNLENINNIYLFFCFYRIPHQKSNDNSLHIWQNKFSDYVAKKAGDEYKNYAQIIDCTTATGIKQITYFKNLWNECYGFYS